MCKRPGSLSLALSVTTMLSAAFSSSAMAASRHSSLMHKMVPAAHKTTSRIRTPPHRHSGPYVSKTAENMAVVARHPPRGSVETVSQKMLSEAPAGTNPMKVIAQLPGITFQSGDAQGLDTWSAQIFMHGFQQQEIGMTLDGMPLGEMTYRNYNGLNPIMAISSENVARIDVSQSAGAESMAASNNLGGGLSYVSMTPSDKMGGTAAAGFGSYSTYHTFLRFESGKLNSSGTKFYTSYMRNDSGMWKGYGEQFMQQVNAKLVQPIGHDSSISAFFDWSDLHQNTYPDISPQIIKRVGYGLSSYENGSNSGYIAAVNAANGIYPGKVGTLDDPADAAYYDGSTNTVDTFGGIKADLRLTDRLTWNTTAYGHGERNQTSWATPYFPSPTGSPVSELMKEPEIRRFGIVSALHYDVARNHLGAGVWYENNSYMSPMNAYAQPAVVNGVVQGAVHDPLTQWRDPFAQIFNQNYNTNTFTAFVQDTYNVLPNLALHFGFKSLLSTTNVGDGYLNQEYYGAGARITSGESLTVAKPFLPHISADWHFLKDHELYFDISENARTYAESGYKLSNSPFAVSQTAYDDTKSSIRPETAWTYAIGYRYTGRLVAATVYAYRTNYNNRLQQITEGPVVNPISAVSNVGGVTMNGVDAGLTLTPFRGFALTNSISYNHGVYDQNLVSGSTVYATKGQQVVNYPRFMYKGRVSYEWRGMTAYADGSYTGTRNYSYTGDVKSPGYWLTNVGVQYSFGNMKKYNRYLGAIKNLTVAFNGSNLTNKRYISTMGQNGNPADIATGALTDQSMQIGAPRMFFGSVRADF
ncbi:heme receptor [Gluconobacter sp. DsW_056]|nr:heme receptor [Gluconobacter sp. DsW_056]